MGFLDNVIAAFSPEKAYRREAYKMAYLSLKNYDAGGYERPNQNWRVVNESGELTDRYSRDNVRARARDLERNSDIMNADIGAFRRNVIGGGFALQAKTNSEEINQAIEKAWIKWCKARNCDITGTQSFNDILRMAVVRKKVDGGILFVKRYTSDGYIPFKLQMIEVDELDSNVYSPKYKGNKVVGGIEFNSYNRPVGYWIKKYDVNGYNIEAPVFIKADDVIFYFTKKRPSQLREMSDMAHSISRIRDVNEFMEAVAVKQRIEACLSIFIEKTVPQVGIGRGGEPEANRVSYDGKLISPGMIKELNAGDKVQVVNPSGQSADATSFAKLQQRMIGAGQGLSYEAISRDMAEATYSSARQAIIEDDLSYDEEREQLLSVINEIYETFIISLVLSGKVSLPGFWENKEAYFEHDWTKAPKPWIDPQKESKANQIALQTGQKTYKQIAAENGRDWRDQINDLAEIIEYGDSKGVDMRKILFESYIEQEVKNEEG